MILGMIPMAAKPIHNGHWLLIERASKECDAVIVLTTQKDRKRKGEYTVYGNLMMLVWDAIQIFFPKNVSVSFVKQPWGSIYNIIDAKESEEPGINSYKIFCGPDMVEEHKFDKYYPDLYSNGIIEVVYPSERYCDDLSGKLMRQALSDGDYLYFTKNLPHILSDEVKNHVWTTLSTKG
jgi:cytidyltransferase-like protein